MEYKDEKVISLKMEQREQQMGLSLEDGCLTMKTTNNPLIFIIAIVLMIISSIMCIETRAEHMPQDVVAQEEMHGNQEPIEDQYLNKFMEAIKNRDTDLVCEVWKGEKDESTINLFTYTYDYWAGREITSYKKLREGVREENKEEKRPAGTLYEYEIISGDEQFSLSFVITNESDGGQYIDYFNIQPKTQPIGTIATGKQFTIAHWFMVAIALVEIGFSVYMSVLCVKRKPKLWGLWLLFILAVYGGISISASSVLKKLRFGVIVYTFCFPALLTYPSGVKVCLTIPLGAVVYWAKRRKALKDTEYLFKDDDEITPLSRHG